MEKHRDSEGKLQADKKRFPNGIKALADYVCIIKKYFLKVFHDCRILLGILTISVRIIIDTLKLLKQLLNQQITT